MSYGYELNKRSSQLFELEVRGKGSVGDEEGGVTVNVVGRTSVRDIICTEEIEFCIRSILGRVTEPLSRLA